MLERLLFVISLALLIPGIFGFLFSVQTWLLSVTFKVDSDYKRRVREEGVRAAVYSFMTSAFFIVCSGTVYYIAFGW